MYQLEVVRKITHSIHVPGRHLPGALVWVADEKAARHLLENKLCRWPESGSPRKIPGMPLRRSEGWPVDSFAVVEPEWAGRTVVCVGSGPSTEARDLLLLQLARERDEIRIIVCNDMYLVVPFADVLYFADSRWWEWHRKGIAKRWSFAQFTADEQRRALQEFKGQKCSIFATGHSVQDPDVFILQLSESRRGLSENPRELVTGGNSGYQAVNLAVLAGARRVLLVGYDMGFSGGATHSHNGHPVKPIESVYARYAQNFSSIKSDKIINCSRVSAVTAFPRARLEDALCALTS
jgi:hypothetical protein